MAHTRRSAPRGYREGDVSLSSRSLCSSCVCVCVSHSVVFYSLQHIGCSPSGSPVHGIFQARILEYVAIPFSRGNPTQGSNLDLLHCSYSGHFVQTAAPGGSTFHNRCGKWGSPRDYSRSHGKTKIRPHSCQLLPSKAERPVCSVPAAIRKLILDKIK